MTWDNIRNSCNVFSFMCSFWKNIVKSEWTSFEVNELVICRLWITKVRRSAVGRSFPDNVMTLNMIMIISWHLLDVTSRPQLQRKWQMTVSETLNPCTPPISPLDGHAALNETDQWPTVRPICICRVWTLNSMYTATQTPNKTQIWRTQSNATILTRQNALVAQGCDEWWMYRRCDWLVNNSIAWHCATLCCMPL